MSAKRKPKTVEVGLVEGEKPETVIAEIEVKKVHRETVELEQGADGEWAVVPGGAELPTDPEAERPELEGPVRRFLGADRRRRSREGYLKALGRAVRLLGSEEEPQDYPWHLFRLEEAVTLEAAMKKAKHAKRSRNQVRAAVRGVLKQCRRMKLMDADTYTELIEDHLQAETIDPVVDKHDWTPPTVEDLEKLHAVCRDAGAIGLRDLVIFELLQLVRRFELAALEVRDVDLLSRRVTVREGKGGRKRVEPLDLAALPLLEEWKSHLKKQGRKGTEDPFVGRFIYRRNGKGAVRYQGDKVSPQTVYDVCRKRCKQAEIPLIRPHDWRRLYCTTHLKNGTPLHIAQKLMGHADAATTATYDHSGFEEMEKWAGNASLPWHRKPEE